MCLAVPALIRRIEGSTAEVELGGVVTRANVMFTPDARVGDYIVMHAGYAISVMEETEAREVLDILGEISKADETN